MSDQPRDWDKELAAIDKAMARGPAPAAGAPVATKGSAAPAAVPKRAAVATWLRVLLGLTLAGAMTQWPYAHQCGVELYFYLGCRTHRHRGRSVERHLLLVPPARLGSYALSDGRAMGHLPRGPGDPAPRRLRQAPRLLGLFLTFPNANHI